MDNEKDFAGFCAKHGFESMPTDPKIVSLYLTHLSKICKFSTLKRRLASISVIHKLSGHYIDIKHPKLFAIVFLHQYILDPLYVLILAILMKPPLYQVYGMFTVILTPATAASSVSAYTVDADVPFALALSIASLVQSILLTPILFTLMMTVYAARVKEASNAIKMPYFRMFILMSYVIMIIGIGYKMRQKMRSDLVDKIGYYFQNGSIILLFTSILF